MKKISPCLWFDNNALEAVNYYIDAFKNGKIESTSYYPENSQMPKDTVLTIKFSINDTEFIALNGGPYFKFTPAISFFVDCKSSGELDALWEKLSEGGFVLMELGNYGFSEKFGWLQDKYGVSWQLNLSGKSKITPFLMFVGDNYGNAEEAMNFYTSIFEDGDVKILSRHQNSEMETEGTVQEAVFTLCNQELRAMDSGFEHNFTFTEAISFYVYCKDQSEIDYFWEKLTDGGEESQCGWLKDKFGISWQIVNESIEKMMLDKNPDKVKKFTDALYKMKKIDIKVLKEAFDSV